MDEPEKPKRDHRNPRNAPCPMCGGTQFEWGEPTSSGGVWFSQGFLDQQGLRARKCVECGNVQMFTKLAR